MNESVLSTRGLAAAFLLALGAFVFADEAGAMRAFAKASRTEPELFVFLKNMPKGGDLHVHVSGAVYSDAMLDAAIEKGMFFDPETAQFSNDASKVPAKKLLTDNQLLYRFLNAASMRGWMGGGQSGHDHFFSTFGIFGGALSAVPAGDVIAEVVGRAKAQHEQYMELMMGVTPGAATNAYFQNLPSSADMDKALDTLKPKLEELLKSSKPFLDEREKFANRIGQTSMTGPNQPITVRYIWSCNRLDAPDTFFAEAAAGIYLAANEPRIVAMNMVAPEDHPLSRKNFDLQMAQIDFLWKKLGRPNLTLHGGELTPAISPTDTMRNRIRKTIEVGHAKRIGHGVSIAWEDDADGLMAKMKKEGIAVEICLTSNASILGVSGQQHPLHLYRDRGVPVFLNTDDEGVSRSTLTLEWVKAVKDQGMTYRDLVDMARNSLEYSFLKGDSLYQDGRYDRIRPSLAGCRTQGWTPSAEAQKLIDASPKMQVQLRFERELAAFEARY